MIRRNKKAGSTNQETEAKRQLHELESGTRKRELRIYCLNSLQSNVSIAVPWSRKSDGSRHRNSWVKNLPSGEGLLSWFPFRKAQIMKMAELLLMKE